mmetsp:Transcript_2453/g.5293  ORF Transcript_2453/g.5293 Transcript_2453/m.5293 type:complete len:500 (+) Transcript_2453:66-1565(+)
MQNKALILGCGALLFIPLMFIVLLVGGASKHSLKGTRMGKVSKKAKLVPVHRVGHPIAESEDDLAEIVIKLRKRQLEVEELILKAQKHLKSLDEQEAKAVQDRLNAAAHPELALSEAAAVAAPAPAEEASKALSSPLVLDTDDLPNQYFPNILFVVYTDAIFFSTRLTHCMTTWGTMVDKRSVIVVGDKGADNVAGVKVLGTTCPAKSHEEGACCKYAVAIYEVYRRMLAEPQIEAAFLFDDDVYFRPAATANYILGKAREHANQPAMFGLFGCATKLCKGLCAGAGYGVNRKGIFQLVSYNDQPLSMEDFIEEEMAGCRKCERWADQAMTDVANKHKLTLVNYDTSDIHGWALKKHEVKTMVGDGREPMFFHYVKGERQFRFLQQLFEPGPVATKSCPAKTHVEKFAVLKDSEEKGGLCANFRGRLCCLTRAEVALTNLHRRLLAAPSDDDVFTDSFGTDDLQDGHCPNFISSNVTQLSGMDDLESDVRNFSFAIKER